MPSLRPLSFERKLYELEEQLQALEADREPTSEKVESIRTIRVELNRMKRDTYDGLSPWDIVQVARHEARPQTLDYIELLFDEFVELHGDKAYRDDRAILTGMAKLDDIKLMFIGQQKGRNLEERQRHNFGMAHPEGYRKALAKMETAAKFGLPIVCLIDTAGAYPGIGAEERGQAYQIALNLREMSRIATPIVCVIIGEGGSGGALGIGIGDHIAILEFAYYSVISPEGCAGILWKHQKFADRAAQSLRFTARDLLQFGIVDEIIKEPLGGAHRDHRGMATRLKGSLAVALRRLIGIPGDELLQQRYDKFRRFGVFEEQTAAEVERDTAH